MFSNPLTEVEVNEILAEVLTLLEFSGTAVSYSISPAQPGFQVPENNESYMQSQLIVKIIKNVTSHLLGQLKLVNKEITQVPRDLQYIIEEISVRRYNRVGTEGMQSESVEGHSVTYYSLEDDFVPYLSIIESYQDDKAEQVQGKVWLI